MCVCVCVCVCVEGGINTVLYLCIILDVLCVHCG